MAITTVIPIYFGAIYAPDAYIDPLLKEAVQYNLEKVFIDQENIVLAIRNQKDNVCSWLIFPFDVFDHFWVVARPLMNQTITKTSLPISTPLEKIGWIQILRDITSSIHTYQILRLNSAGITDQHTFRVSFFYEMEQVPISVKDQEVANYCSEEYFRQPDKVIEDIIEGLKTIDIKMQTIMLKNSSDKMQLQVHDVSVPNNANTTNLNSFKGAQLVFNRRKAVDVILGYDRTLESGGFAYKRQPKNVRTLELYLDLPRVTVEYLLQMFDKMVIQKKPK